MKPLYIFDIDGTLSLLDHRRHILDSTDPDKWDRFYALCGEDPPNKPVLHILELLIQNDNEIWLFTGRRESERELTTQWLSDYSSIGIAVKYDPNILTMRPNRDYTDDATLKESWLNSMLNIDRDRLVATFDDRQRVVDMWRNNGITCFQVAEGNF